MASYVNKYTISSLVFVIILVVLYFYARHNGVLAIRKECEERKIEEIKGIVMNSYYSYDVNDKGFFIVFADGRKYKNPVFLKSLSGILNERDSIIKKSGSFDFEIYRKDGENSLIFKNDINCECLGK